MKKTFIRLLAVFVCAILLFSCENATDDCDIKVNKFLLEHQSEYENLDRDSWLALPDSTQRLAYLCMSPASKHKFWLHKLEETKLVEDWNAVEIAHIEKFSKYIKATPQLFEKDALNDTKLLKEFEDFVERWRKFADEDLDWTDEVQYFIIADGNSYIDLIATFEALPDNAWCSCSQKSDWCNRVKKKCVDTGCLRDAGDGCGTLWLYHCDGKCK